MKIKFDEYQISLLTQLFGISPDGIRLYAQKGLLNPIRNKDNRYRIFSRGDVFSMEYIMRLKAMGFSLEQIRNAICESDIDGCELMVSNRIKDIDDEIHDLIRSKKKLVHYKDCLKKVTDEAGVISVRENVTLLYTDILTTFEETENEFKLLDESLIPMLTMSDAEFTAGEDSADMYTREKADFIFMCEATTKSLAKLSKKNTKIRVIQESRCLTTVLSFYTDKDYKGLNCLKAFLKENDMHCKSELLLQYIGSIKIYGEPQDFYKVWLPIE